jgi:hypothetical protein
MSHSILLLFTVIRTLPLFSKLARFLYSYVHFLGFDCSGKDDGAHGESCSKDYWQGLATSQECPENFMFNDANGECDYPANVIACSGVQETTTFASDFAEMPAGTRLSLFVGLC